MYAKLDKCRQDEGNMKYCTLLLTTLLIRGFTTNTVFVLIKG